MCGPILDKYFLLPIKPFEILINNGAALAELCLDRQMKELKKLDGSPTYLLNENRQKLFGNIGYKISEANILELLKTDKRVRQVGANLCLWVIFIFQ